MRGQPQGCHRSVDRGKCRQGIELRNNRDRSADVVQHGGRQHRGVRYSKHLEDSAQSEAPGMHGNSTRENRETPWAPAVLAGRLEKAMSRESNMHAGGESDGCVLPSKCPNKGGPPSAEGMEGRQPTKENIGQATAPRTQSRISEWSDLHGVRKAARKASERAVRRQISKVGAVCGNSARTDLCGGRWETVVPTATKHIYTVIQDHRLKPVPGVYTFR